jgi:hypothetical protein
MKAKLSTDYPLNFNNNIDPFVPPNPNEFVMTVSSPAFSTVSVAISSGFNAGSNVSTLIDGAIKSFSSISRQLRLKFQMQHSEPFGHRML